MEHWAWKTKAFWLEVPANFVMLCLKTTTTTIIITISYSFLLGSCMYYVRHSSSTSICLWVKKIYMYKYICFPEITFFFSMMELQCWGNTRTLFVLSCISCVTCLIVSNVVSWSSSQRSTYTTTNSCEFSLQDVCVIYIHYMYFLFFFFLLSHLIFVVAVTLGIYRVLKA